MSRTANLVTTSVSYAPAAVVAAEGEALEAEVPHHLDLVERHRPLGVGFVVWCTLWLGGVSVAPEVRDDHREVLGEAWGDEVPHGERLGAAVEQQHRRSLAPADDVDGRPLRFDPDPLEALEHAQTFPRCLVRFPTVRTLTLSETPAGHH